MSIVVDFSHVHRHITGIERVSLDLFSEKNFDGIDVAHVRAKSTLGMIWAQWVRLPLLALIHPKATFICPGFPPSVPLSLLARDRVIPYIHDLFLIDRTQDLNRTAKWYMRPSFRFAVRFLKTFLVNSEYTAQQLRKHCSNAAVIHIVFPPVADVFGLTGTHPPTRDKDSPFRLVSIGTIEPRKNYRYAAELRAELEKLLGRAVELHLVGRTGWGDDVDWLKRQTGVTIHGYCSSDEVSKILRSADVFLSTSKDEGLGLPLLEVQHGGLFVAASDIPVYREVLSDSGYLLPLNDAKTAAHHLANVVARAKAGGAPYARSVENVREWNTKAAAGKQAFLVMLQKENALPAFSATTPLSTHR